jgi:hypothetical protein
MFWRFRCGEKNKLKVEIAAGHSMTRWKDQLNRPGHLHSCPCFDFPLEFQFPRFPMIKKILLGLVAVLSVFAIVVAFQPAAFQVVRTTKVAVPPQTVFAEVNNLHKWDAWSPWAKLDPAMKVTHEGAPAGKGAIYSWAGNKDVGEGRMTITESRPAELVRINLEFIKPFAATNLTEFTFKPDGNQTSVTWTMSGEKNFISKAVCMFMSMDQMVGGDFEKGLAALKAVAEGSARK